MKIKNITLSEFFSKSQKDFYRVDNIMNSVNPVNSFLGKTFSLDVVSYEQFKSIQKLLKDGNTFEHISSIFSLAFGVTKEEFFSARISDYYPAKNFIVNKVKESIETESKLLGGGVKNIDWEQAGGNRLDVFGKITPLVKLGKIYGMFPDEVGKKPYNWVITLLVFHNTEDEVINEYQKIKSKK